MLLSRTLRWTLLAGLGCAAMACGPSFQAIYEGDQRFEHCYALDDNPSIALQDKGNCWRDWMQNYTYGQTRDRVEYAAVRQRALSRTGIPTDEAMMEAAPGQVVSRSVATPAPTSAFEPPPKTLNDAPRPETKAPPPVPVGPASTTPVPAASSSAPLSKPAPAGSVVFVAPTQALDKAMPPPGAACQEDCSHSWQACSGKGERPDAKPETPCAKTYRTCMRGCFK